MACEIIDVYWDRPRLYLCDPEKNEKCKKTCCQIDCFYTTDRKCRKNNAVYHVNSKGDIIKTRG